ncbi:hypothetical protein [Pontibacillus yanchengensis]|uniref:IDEAL domain-containing protein n=1 Tax=Pontibacillus yanchengensis Y32 TaxID=1385514 RepID=A0A0A2TQ52_9BACI|nr:hypothetical protein [Pontibacillus yanchengensis]KGP71415.1 hypothetical protein N782_19585 [Pontibacillus yanchengensis Y32]
MYSSFIVTAPFKHEVECFCSDVKHTNTITFRKGDHLYLTEEKRYVDDIGWYFKVLINDMYSAYFIITDLEKLYQMEYLHSLFDIELEINYYQYKVNQALDEKDEETFTDYVTKLEKRQKLLQNKNKSASAR